MTKTTSDKQEIARLKKAAKDDLSMEDMSNERMGLYNFFRNRMIDATNGNLTRPEYHHLAQMELFLHDYDDMVKDIGVKDMDTTLIDTSRKFREKILTVLEKSRKAGDKPTPFLESLKELAYDIEKEGTLIRMKFKGDEDE